MHRQTILSLLEAYDDQLSLRNKFINFINEHKNCFDRENEFGHLTASGWLVDKAGKKVLLTHHKKLNMWLQPGGHCDGECDVASVALKEAQEETGILDWQFLDGKIFDIDCHTIPARKKEPEHYHFDIRFVMLSQDAEEYVVSEESHDLAWVPLDQLEKYTQEESILRMARKWFKKQSFAEPSL